MACEGGIDTSCSMKSKLANWNSIIINNGRDCHPFLSFRDQSFLLFERRKALLPLSNLFIGRCIVSCLCDYALSLYSLGAHNQQARQGELSTHVTRDKHRGRRTKWFLWISTYLYISPFFINIPFALHPACSRRFIQFVCRALTVSLPSPQLDTQGLRARDCALPKPKTANSVFGAYSHAFRNANYTVDTRVVFPWDATTNFTTDHIAPF